jgi:hypothetical protein
MVEKVCDQMLRALCESQLGWGRQMLLRWGNSKNHSLAYAWLLMRRFGVRHQGSQRAVATIREQTGTFGHLPERSRNAVPGLRKSIRRASGPTYVTAGQLPPIWPPPIWSRVSALGAPIKLAANGPLRCTIRRPTMGAHVAPADLGPRRAATRPSLCLNRASPSESVFGPLFLVSQGYILTF